MACGAKTLGEPSASTYAVDIRVPAKEKKVGLPWYIARARGPCASRIARTFVPISDNACSQVISTTSPQWTSQIRQNVRTLRGIVRLLDASEISGGGGTVVGMRIDDTDKIVLDGPAIQQEGLADWRVLHGVLHARFETGDFNAGVTLVQAIGAAADEMNHHPDVDLTYPCVDVRLSSHDVGGVTRRDVVLARVISEMASTLDAHARPEVVSVLELALDTPDHEQIKPFWCAVLDYERTDRPDELADPTGKRPTLWFQPSESHETPRQRWHLDLRVPPEVVEARIAAALEAGGRLVSDKHAPMFWVLADPQGNQACLTTWQGRDHA